MSRAVRRSQRLLRLLRVVAVLWHYRLALWLLPFRQVTRMAERHTSKHHTSNRAASGEASRREQRRLARTVERAAWFVPRATCLVRVLTGAHLFAAQNKRSRIIIGVRKRAGALEAHAWLESGEQVVLGNVYDLASYHPLR